MVTITEVIPYKMDILLAEPFSISFKTYTHSHGSFVVIKTDEGIEGYGEGCPDKPITGDSQEESLIFLEKASKYLVGAQVDIENIHGILDKVERELFPSQTARNAIDIAIYDILGKLEDKPIYKMLGSSSPNIVPTTLTIGLRSIEETKESARKYMERFEKNGLRRIKLKLSGDPESDFQRVSAVIDVFPGEITLDANQGYKDPKEAVKTLEEIYGIAGKRVILVEEPVPKGELDLLKYVSDNSPIPVFADESAATLEDVRRIAETGSASGINIKLQKAGGVYYARKIADISREYGLKLMVGCNEETFVAISAAINFVASDSSVINADLDSDLLVIDVQITEENPLEYFRNGSRYPTDKPGLGITLKNWFRDLLYGKISLKKIPSGNDRTDNL
ncbi:MAG: dipeptide epimerase [Candidatus Korarchaeota archaeon]|nr:dipeptide epimerase [Candidatus Korarchaeota archaeon]